MRIKSQMTHGADRTLSCLITPRDTRIKMEKMSYRNQTKVIMTTPSTAVTEEESESSEEGFEIINQSSESLCSVSAENYLSLPEEVLAMSTNEELENAIANCKALILSKPDDSEERKWLVRRIIELRLRLEKMREIKEETDSEKFKETNKVMLGHHFTLQSFPTSTLHYYCDRCSGIIWNVLHSWYLCSDCDYKCHIKCLSYVCRVCAHVIVSENPDYVTDICPEAEDGLANQNYRCAECLAHTSFRTNVLEPRLCDYTGKYYCPTCHWNSTSVIPARVIFNWDFKERLVCRSSKQILKLMATLPVLKLEELNPVLFACIEELGTVKVDQLNEIELRQQLMQIKKYLTSCKSAVEGQLLWQFSDKLHFLENEDSYSLQDLMDLRSGELIKYLNKIKEDFIRHIQVECEVCRGRGFICELCKDKKIIFPFEENVISCAKCQSTYHFFCWVKHNKECPKCNRIQQRMLKIETDGISSAVDS